MNLLGRITSNSAAFLSQLPDLWISKVLLLLFAFFGAVGGIVVVWQGAQRNLFRKRIWLRKISRLAPGTTLAFFTANLGTPVFVWTEGETKRYVFVDRLFYIEAVTDSDNTVLMYAVTTRSKHFNPKLTLGPYSSDKSTVRVQLGKTTFTEIDALEHEGTVISGMGARRIFYAEQFYFGNPGLYQQYAVGCNDAGFMRRDESITFGVLNENAGNTRDPRLQSFRKAMLINTYAVGAPHFDMNSIIGRLGADYDQVRVLPQ